MPNHAQLWECYKSGAEESGVPHPKSRNHPMWALMAPLKLMVVRLYPRPGTLFSVCLFVCLGGRQGEAD